ncbi:MAG: hypothetical protein WC827_00215 [Candidatus Paceibacterota bacterium]|jgi:hypothetical protein
MKSLQKYLPIYFLFIFIIIIGFYVFYIKYNTISNIDMEYNKEIKLNNILKTKNYYDGFRKKCEVESVSVGCCLSSVNNAELVSSLIFNEKSLNDVICPDNFIPVMNKCEGSYQWCE